MTRTRADVFFYGLLMDPELLREKGARPEAEELCSLAGYRLVIGRRAWLKPEEAATCQGMVINLSYDEIEALYSPPDLADYRPIAVLLDVRGRPTPALCYNLLKGGGHHSHAYAAKLRAVAEKVGLPPAYVASLTVDGDD